MKPPFVRSCWLVSLGLVLCLAALRSTASGQDIPQLLADAEKGGLAAESNLAAVYEHGSGTTPQDYAKALQLYLKMAEQGDAGAMARIGYFYERGREVDKDVEQALAWYKK